MLLRNQRLHLNRLQWQIKQDVCVADHSSTANVTLGSRCWNSPGAVFIQTSKLCCAGMGRHKTNGPITAGLPTCSVKVRADTEASDSG